MRVHLAPDLGLDKTVLGYTPHFNNPLPHLTMVRVATSSNIPNHNDNLVAIAKMLTTMEELCHQNETLQDNIRDLQQQNATYNWWSRKSREPLSMEI